MAIVASGIVLAAVLGRARGMDARSLVIFGLLVAVGALAIAVARASSSARVAPGSCPECGGLVSRNAPFCKHCGAPLARPDDQSSRG